MDSVFEFAKAIAGIYDNYEQAQANPKDFARINIVFRPLPWNIFSGPGFYSEQHYDYAPWDPYRQGIHRLITHQTLDDTCIMENFSFSNPDRLAGAGRNPELLKSIKTESLKPRCGCNMYFKKIADGHYVGSVEPGKKCIVPKDGILTYLVSEVEINQENWISRDRGYNKDNDQQCWGSEHGHLRFKKVKEIGQIISTEWINHNAG